MHMKEDSIQIKRILKLSSCKLLKYFRELNKFLKYTHILKY